MKLIFLLVWLIQSLEGAPFGGNLNNISSFLQSNDAVISMNGTTTITEMIITVDDPTDRSNDVTVTLYTHEKYEGPEKMLGMRQGICYDLTDFDKKLSSIKGEHCVILYGNPGCTGLELQLNDGHACRDCLVDCDPSFNDKTRSLQLCPRYDTGTTSVNMSATITTTSMVYNQAPATPTTNRINTTSTQLHAAISIPSSSSSAAAPTTVKAIESSTEAGINWQSGRGGRWAVNCDFPGNDISMLDISTQQCGAACNEMPECTQYTWSGHSKKCLLKNGRNEAVALDHGGICGYSDKSQEVETEDTISDDDSDKSQEVETEATVSDDDSDKSQEVETVATVSDDDSNKTQQELEIMMTVSDDGYNYDE